MPQLSKASLACLLLLGVSPVSLAAPQCSSGGPGGEFDWVIPAGTTVLLDTHSDLITGGPGGVPTFVQQVTGGVVEVRDLIVEPGALLLFQGSNPPVILASRDVQVDGWIRLDGLDGASLGLFGSLDLPAPGAPGRTGGGSGGTGSPNVGQSSAQGERGFGAYDFMGEGGEGGESGFAFDDKDLRRGAGGGGGRFGADLFVELQGVKVEAQNMVGMDAEGGFAGGPGGSGALTQNRRAKGGDIGPSPFPNGRAGDDFFGTMVTPIGQVIQGELPNVWGGAGGGAGGDAVNSASFPLVPFTVFGQQRGAGGGAGGGSITILAERDVRVGLGGRITADGGMGGAGESFYYFDRVGGGGGGGSGGHIVLQAGGEMNFEAVDVAAGVGDLYVDNSTGIRSRSITALGGQGGAGQNNRGGGNQDGGTSWRCDAIPYDAFVAGIPTAPLEISCFRSLNGVGDDQDPFLWEDPNNVTNPGGGGDGSPGIIQLHVASTHDILLPPEAGGDLTKLFVPPPVGWHRGVFRGRLEPDLCWPLSSTWGGGLAPLGFSLEEGVTGPDRALLAGRAAELLTVDFHPRVNRGG